MEFVPTDIPDVLLIKPEIYRDDRGFFMETFRKELLEKRDITIEFVQDNLSLSRENAVRGLHYQVEQPQDKLIMIMKGKVLDVAVDLRRNSPTFGHFTSHILSEENRHQLFVPKGFAHGFSVLSTEALVFYKCSDYYYPEGERGLKWNDPVLNIDWKVNNPVISEKDRKQPYLKDIPNKDLFS